MKLYILNLLLLTSLSCFGQDLKCSDFHKGDFILTSTYENATLISKVERNENEQIETIVNLPEEFKDLDIITVYYAKIEWLNECSYRMTYDENKMELNSLLNSYNENGGILVELIEIEGNCFLYNSSFMLNGKTNKIKGKLCKE